MSKLSYSDKEYLENALRLDTGFILHFSDATFRDFFSAFGINIDDPKYAVNGTSKAKRMQTFWQLESNRTVGEVILELSGLMRNKELSYPFSDLKIKFSVELEKIGNKLLAMPDNLSAPQTVASAINDNHITIEIRPEIYGHIKSFLASGHLSTAVEEAYKIVRSKLEEITGYEKATDAFKAENLIKIFGHEPANPKEKDFFDGVKYLNMAIQFLRNEKTHIPASQLDKNLAIHYLSLASLAYDLISRGEND